MEKKIIFLSLLLVINLTHTRRLWESSIQEISADTIQATPIEAQQLQITNLTGILRQSFLSKLRNVTELRIIHNQLTYIEPGALCSSPTLKILELDLSRNKNPPTLTKPMFDNCKLEELFLKFDYNYPSKINRNALENLNLKVLAIDSLELPQLEKDFLSLEESDLTSLVLSHIHVNTVHENVFSGLSNLEEVEIVHNVELSRIPVGVFRGLTKLKRLSLRDNAIFNLTWDEFEGLAKLEELVVADNKIEHFDEEKIAKNMPKLKKLEMELNPIGCEEENTFVEQLKEKLQGIDVTSKKTYSLC